MSSVNYANPIFALLLTAFAATSVQAEVLGAHPPMFLVQAEFALDAGNAERAIDLLEQRYKRLRAPADRMRGYAVLCRAYLLEDNIERALGVCTRATRMDLATWSDFNNRGVLELRLGKHAAALRSFERAVELNPQADSVRQNIVQTQAIIDQNLLSATR